MLVDAVWINKPLYDRAECQYYERLSKRRKQAKSDSHTEANNISNKQNANTFLGTTGSLAKEFAKARQQIKESLQSVNTNLVCAKESNKSHNIESRVEALERENRELRKDVEELRKILINQLKLQSA